MNNHLKIQAIREKFGGDYEADANTFIMGIDQRFTSHFAERFCGLRVLETCTGGGFTTISLARSASHVTTVEIEPSHQAQAVGNVKTAGLLPRVTFIRGDVMHPDTLAPIGIIEAVFADPDWAVTGPLHIHRFIRSTTRPPADMLLKKMLDLCPNVALVLPPTIDTKEFIHLPRHEREKLYLGNSHELFCLYFGSLIRSPGETEFHVSL